MTASPSVGRVVDVVEFLATDPDREVSLSELCRRLDLSKATAHALLATLRERGWVVRHPRDRTYRIGPGLLSLAGVAVGRRLEAVDYARDEMRTLAQELDLQCVASAVVGGDIVLLAAVGKVRPLGVHVQAGQRLPLAPPLGTVFLAWSSDEEIDRWLRRLGPEASESHLAGYRRAVARVRARGYAISLEADARALLEQALSLPEGARGGSARGRRPLSEVMETLGQQEYLLTDLEARHSYRLSLLAAPVFGPEGTVQLALSLIDLPPVLAAEEVPELGRRLLRSAGAVTAAIGGRHPDTPPARRSR